MKIAITRRYCDQVPLVVIGACAVWRNVSYDSAVINFVQGILTVRPSGAVVIVPGIYETNVLNWIAGIGKVRGCPRRLKIARCPNLVVSPKRPATGIEIATGIHAQVAAKHTGDQKRNAWLPATLN